MNIKDIFKIGGVRQAVNGVIEYVDWNNGIIIDKEMKKDKIVLRLKRNDNNQEAFVSVRLREVFQNRIDLLRKFFISKVTTGVTLNQIYNLQFEI